MRSSVRYPSIKPAAFDWSSLLSFSLDSTRRMFQPMLNGERPHATRLVHGNSEGSERHGGLVNFVRKHPFSVHLANGRISYD